MSLRVQLNFSKAASAIARARVCAIVAAAVLLLGVSGVVTAQHGGHAGGGHFNGGHAGGAHPQGAPARGGATGTAPRGFARPNSARVRTASSAWHSFGPMASARSPIVGNFFFAHRGFRQRGRFFGGRFFPGALGFGFFDLPFGWGGGWYPYCGDYGFYPYYDCPADVNYPQQDPGQSSNANSSANPNPSQNFAPGDSFGDSSDSRPMVVFVTKDGTTYGASDYWQQDGMVHIASTSGGEKSFPIADLDTKHTAEVNAARGVYFTLYPAAMASTGAELASSTYTAPACNGNAVTGSPAASAGSEMQFGVIGDETSRGLRVTSVTANSLAVKAGIQPGDVITRIGCNDVHNLAELNAATAASGGDTIWASYLIQGNWLSEKPIKVR